MLCPCVQICIYKTKLIKKRTASCPFFLFKPKTLRRGASSESLLLTFAKNQFNSERYDVTKTFATEVGCTPNVYRKGKWFT